MGNLADLRDPRRILHVALLAATAAGCSTQEQAPTPSADPSVGTAAEGSPTESAPTPAEPPAPVVQAPAPPKPYEPRPEDVVEPHQPIENVERLASFFDALAELDDGADRKVRVTMWGDSAIGGDRIPHALRTRLQTRFGDGGAGFLFLHRYKRTFNPKGVRYTSSEDWLPCYIAFKCHDDGHYGLGGVSFRAGKKGRKSWAAAATLPEDEPVGTAFSQAEVWYAALPEGGSFEIELDGEVVKTVSTKADALEDRWEALEFPMGPHEVKVRAKGDGRTRLYGLAVETDGPGVVFEGHVLNGLFVTRLLAWDDEHIAGQVKHRDPELLIFNFGGNDLMRFAHKAVRPERYAEDYGKVIAKTRAGKPGVPCLVVGVHDHGMSGKSTVSNEAVETAVETQRKAADMAGCAYFSNYDAMGGADSHERWRKKGLAAGDRKHITNAGRKVLAGYMYDALITGYVARREETHLAN